MTTEYELHLDRAACDGVFACLVRDDRFVEADDGLAAVVGGEELTATAERQVLRFDDDSRGDAEQAARACPVDAIAVREVTDD